MFFKILRKIIICTIILLPLLFFGYKKTMLDYDGEYATDRLVYTTEYGFCMLVTYYPEFRQNEIKGYTVTNIPFAKLFSEKIMAHTSDDTADSLDSYTILVLAEAFGGIGADEVGKYGKYYIIRSKKFFDD